MTTMKKIILVSTALTYYVSANVPAVQPADIAATSASVQTLSTPTTGDYVDPKTEHAKYQGKKAAAKAAATLAAEEPTKKPQLRDLRGRFTTLSNLLDDLSSELKLSTPDFAKCIKLLERMGVKITTNNNTYHLLWSAKDTKNDIHKGCHKPHGAQLKKGDKAAWVITMKDMEQGIRGQN